MLVMALFSSTPPSSSCSPPAVSSLPELAPACGVAVVKTTSDVTTSWSLAAAMQAYQTLGCQTPGATGFGSTPAFYGQSPSPYSAIPAGSYSDGRL